MWGRHEIDKLQRVVSFPGLDKLWSRLRRSNIARIAHRFELIAFDEAHQPLLAPINYGTFC